MRFLAFTKSFDLDYSERPDNLTIIWSIWTDTKLERVPPGPRAYAGDCVPKGAKTIHCPGNCDTCGMCWDIANVGKDVRFDIH